MCCQLLSLSTGLPLKGSLAMRGILYAWCDLSLLFHTLVQEGVGDTPDSYAYDGNRVRKWNVTTTNYGKVSSCPPGMGWRARRRKQVTPAHWILVGLVKCPQAFLPASVCVPALVCTLGMLDVLSGCFV